MIKNDSSLKLWAALAGLRKLRKRHWLVIGLLSMLAYLWLRDPPPPINRVGSLSGVPLSIPSNYFIFPLEYAGESVWEPRKDPPLRTLDSPIQAFSLYVQWPSMQPRNKSNMDSYDLSRRGKFGDGMNEWFMVSLVASTGSPRTLDENGTNGLSRVLETKLKRMTQSSAYLQHPEPIDESKYIFHPPGPSTFGLHKAESRIRLEKESLREVLYWRGGRGGLVETLIYCYRRHDKTAPGRCSHHLIMNGFMADVVLYYDYLDEQWLPEWQQREQRAQALIESFRVDAK